MCMGVLIASISVCHAYLVPAEARSPGMLDLLELELQVVVSCHIGTATQAWVLIGFLDDRHSDYEKIEQVLLFIFLIAKNVCSFPQYLLVIYISILGVIDLFIDCIITLGI